MSPTDITVGFEVFPPKTDDGLDRLTEVVARLATVEPNVVSVTYGAGGSSRHRSFAAIRAVRRSGVPVAAHLTCVGQSMAEVVGVMETYRGLGVERIVALRGDPADGVGARYHAHPGGFQRTADLVAVAARRFEVTVSAYPERHPQSPTLDHDLDVLAAKVDAGATSAITQMCFDDDAVARYLNAVRARRIEVDIVPGIFPIHSFPAVAGFAAKCGASMPASVATRFAGLDDDAAGTAAVAADLAARQIRRLADLGVTRFHLYTLNRADLALDVCERVGISERVRT
ncbi:MAG: methylenetetrahydrofolate reductase [Ilumatobacteraceae bacterium]